MTKQIRLLFNRKNKTLRAVLTTKVVLKLLHENRQTAAALNNGMHAIKQEVAELVESIVSRDPWKGQRASKMDLDDFLQLLSEFHEAGIHFSS